MWGSDFKSTVMIHTPPLLVTALGLGVFVVVVWNSLWTRLVLNSETHLPVPPKCWIKACTTTTQLRFFIVKLTHTRYIWEESGSIEELPPSDWPVGMSVGIFLIVN